MAFRRLPSLILNVALHKKHPLGIHRQVDLGRLLPIIRTYCNSLQQFHVSFD
jgi:hypothetical protein